MAKCHLLVQNVLTACVKINILSTRETQSDVKKYNEQRKEDFYEEEN